MQMPGLGTPEYDPGYDPDDDWHCGDDSCDCADFTAEVEFWAALDEMTGFERNAPED